MRCPEPEIRPGRKTMRLRSAVALLPVIALMAIAPGIPAETTRTLRVELSADALQRFAVENLAGVMRVTTGDVKSVVAVATVHAESDDRSEEHTSELQSLAYLVCRLLLEKKKKRKKEYLRPPQH